MGNQAILKNRQTSIRRIGEGDAMGGRFDRQSSYRLRGHSSHDGFPFDGAKQEMRPMNEQNMKCIMEAME